MLATVTDGAVAPAVPEPTALNPAANIAKGRTAKQMVLRIFILRKLAETPSRCCGAKPLHCVPLPRMSWNTIQPCLESVAQLWA